MNVTKQLVNIVDEGQEELIELTRDLVKIPSDNPPGDTTRISTYLINYLRDHDIKTEVYEPRKGNPNVLATIGGGDGPNLVLNAHMDQFPSEVGEEWKHDPYDAEIDEGKLYGRGVGDMKAGLSSLVYIFTKIKETDIDLPGKITLTLVSDEETGGRWGMGWLVENIPDVLGDACLSGEPSGLTMRIGEKGECPLLVKTYGGAAHGSFAGYVGENAILKMTSIIPHIEEFDGYKSKLSVELEELMNDAIRGYRQQYGHEAEGMEQVLRHVTVNISVIRGGTSFNIVPAECELKIDLRLPLGINPEDMKADVTNKLKELDPEITVDYLKDESTIHPANYTSPSDPIAQALIEGHRSVTGGDPFISFTSGLTDQRYTRYKGVPSVAYGPRVWNMGGADEYITLKDLQTVSRVHASTICIYLCS